MSVGMWRHRQTAAWMSLPSSKKLFTAQTQAEELLKQVVCLLLDTNHEAMYTKLTSTA